MAATAAYRSGSALRDERYGVTHHYTRLGPAAHAEIMSPAGAPEWVQNREALWNRVELREVRKDSQLARAIEISLPRELSPAENVALLRDYIAQEFVSKGMIADFCVRQNDANQPYAHILLTLREATAAGFGPKMRHWNRKNNLLEWRSAWAERANQHLAWAGHAVRIDHRTLEAQQSELTPARKIGIGGGQTSPTLPGYLQERVAEQQRIAAENGELIRQDPSVALRALCRQRPSFTHAELVEFLRPRTADPAQLGAVLAAVLDSSELVTLPPGVAGAARFTSQDMIDADKSLLKRVTAMATRRGFGGVGASLEARHAEFEYMLGEGDIKALAATDAAAAGTLLAALREVWELRGLAPLGVALSTIAAAALQSASGIVTQTLAAQEQAWAEGRDALAANRVIVVAGAEMIGLKQLERILAMVDKARAKIVLVADAALLEAMVGLAPLRSILDRIGMQAVTARGRMAPR